MFRPVTLTFELFRVCFGSKIDLGLNSWSIYNYGLRNIGSILDAETRRSVIEKDI